MSRHLRRPSNHLVLRSRSFAGLADIDRGLSRAPNSRSIMLALAKVQEVFWPWAANRPKTRSGVDSGTHQAVVALSAPLPADQNIYSRARLPSASTAALRASADILQLFSAAFSAVAGDGRRLCRRCPNPEDAVIRCCASVPKEREDLCL
jgi:hypothetical protein